MSLVHVHHPQTMISDNKIIEKLGETWNLFKDKLDIHELYMLYSNIFLCCYRLLQLEVL
jgi:hypothetical protein